MRTMETEYHYASQTLRTALRQTTCKKGFVLVIEDDECVTEILETVIKARAKITVKTIATSKAANKLINEDSKNIVCAIIDMDLGSGGSGSDVINLIEKSHKEIPYIIYTGMDINDLHKQYPNARVVQKNGSMDKLLAALPRSGDE
jgi:DNA-binding NtrC family response regulator